MTANGASKVPFVSLLPLAQLLPTAGRPRSPMLMSPIPPPAPRPNVITYWLQNRLLSPDRVERHFAFLLAMLVSASVLFALLKTQGPLFLWGSPICSLWASAIIVVTLGGGWAEQRERWTIVELCRLAQFLLAMLSVLIYYDGSNAINRFRYEKRGDAMLYDETLLKVRGNQLAACQRCSHYSCDVLTFVCVMLCFLARWTRRSGAGCGRVVRWRCGWIRSRRLA